MEPVRLHDLVADLVTSTSGVLEMSRITCDIPRDLPLVRADPRRLERVLTNLISNALKHSDPAGPVRLTASGSGGEVRVSISDRGPGIAADDLARIFDRFYRGRGARGDGLGLGLYIVQTLVGAHGGRVSAESCEGEGSTFTFTLPAAIA